MHRSVLRDKRGSRQQSNELSDLQDDDSCARRRSFQASFFILLGFSPAVAYIHTYFYLLSRLTKLLSHRLMWTCIHSMKSKANQPGSVSHCVRCCEHPRVLVAFCVQCNGLICETCFKAHRLFKEIQVEHQPIKLDQFNEKFVSSFIKNQMVCKSHEKKKLEYYCQEETCRLSVCKECAALDHQNHQLQSLEDAGQDSRKLIEGAMNRVEQRKDSYGKELEHSKENIERIQKEIDVAERDVDDVVKMICDIAKDHGRAMKEELKQTLQELTTENNEEQTAIQTKVKDSDEFVLHCRALLERDVAYEEIKSKEMILERGKMLIHRSLKLRPFIATHSNQATSDIKSNMAVPCVTSMNALPKDFGLNFFGSRPPIQRNVTTRYSVTEQVMQSLQDIGRIVKNVTDPARSTIESVKKIRPGFINECKIITRNTEGEVCPTRIESIDVRIKDAEGNEVEMKVSEEQTGKYRVSFKPQQNGRHEIQVNIGRERIMNSPQNADILDVKELFKPLKVFGRSGIDKGQFNYPCSIAVSDNGEIAIAEWGNHRIQIFSLDGNYLRKFVIRRTREGQRYYPCGVMFNGDSRIILSEYATDGKDRMRELNLNGSCIKTIYRHDQWFAPRGMCVNDDKNIAVCCRGKQELGIKPSIKVFSKQGDLVHEFDMPDNNGQPWYITYGNGKYFVSYYDINYVSVFDVNGVFLYKFGEEGERDGQFNGVHGLAVYGPDMILVCDRYNNRVQLFTQEGQFIRSFGAGYGSGVGQMAGPIDVVVTADGRVFVVECLGGRVTVWF
ncbi:E3 ubiquitin-protein ligase TRIM71-like [Actinia tenebrosa]|uniref:E3 ubiquitin-protein ligase TRIM71-like n=1 Tax=Actinia tenebrosa TaxID=6105 RepID=A0A6P8HS50_ACTTE|nr:E3 ubiquitin-protein ligase TRIM71-like [Actinia tenebrosa]